MTHTQFRAGSEKDVTAYLLLLFKCHLMKCNNIFTAIQLFNYFRLFRQQFQLLTQNVRNEAAYTRLNYTRLVRGLVFYRFKKS